MITALKNSNVLSMKMSIPNIRWERLPNFAVSVHAPLSSATSRKLPVSLPMNISGTSERITSNLYSIKAYSIIFRNNLTVY